MAFKISTTCSKCGKSAPEVASFHIVSMDEVICFLCQPPPLEGTCPTCDGHGEVRLFEALAELNQVPSRGRSSALQAAFLKCRTRGEAKTALASFRLTDRYPLLPDWLPEA